MSKALSLEVLAKAKTDYVSDSTITIAELAQRYGLSPDTLATHASRKKWRELRNETNAIRTREIITQMARTTANIIVKEGKEKIIRLIRPAINTIEEVMHGKGGKGSYNRILAARDVLDRAGLKAEDNINVKLSKIMDVVERVTITVTPVPAVPAVGGEEEGQTGMGGSEVLVGAAVPAVPVVKGEYRGGEGVGEGLIPPLTGVKKDVLEVGDGVEEKQVEGV